MQVGIVLTVLIFIIDSVTCNQILSLNSDNDSKLAKFISKLINESNQKISGSHDIAILEVGEENSFKFSDLKNEISRVISENSVTLFPSQGSIRSNRKFSLVIIFLGVRIT
jgi:hypothetical protein